MLEAEGHRSVRYQIEGRHSVPLHVHDVPQFGVVTSESGVHRLVLRVTRGGRERPQTTEFTVRSGDCYYIPAATPHSCSMKPGRPAALVDIMVDDPRPTTEVTAARRDDRRAVAGHRK